MSGSEQSFWKAYRPTGAHDRTLPKMAIRSPRAPDHTRFVGHRRSKSCSQSEGRDGRPVHSSRVYYNFTDFTTVKWHRFRRDTSCRNGSLQPGLQMFQLVLSGSVIKTRIAMEFQSSEIVTRGKTDFKFVLQKVDRLLRQSVLDYCIVGPMAPE